MAFPIAGVAVSIGHLLTMGFVTGYVMALVGQASGLFSLAYSVSVLQFTGIAVSPTSLVTTFINPFGALLGYWRNRQWNIDLALWLCVGAVVGSPLGPLIRVYWLSEPEPFKVLIGVILVFMSVYLWIELAPWYRRRVARVQAKSSHTPDDGAITTLQHSLTHITLRYAGQVATFSVPGLFFWGFAIAIIGATLGIGGGFLLVPLLAIVYRLPMVVIVAASIPYVIVMSLTGLLSYLYVLPWLTGISTQADWAFGLFVGCGALVGAWVAAKTQRAIPERGLKLLLAIVTAAAGLFYVMRSLSV